MVIEWDVAGIIKSVVAGIAAGIIKSFVAWAFEMFVTWMLEHFVARGRELPAARLEWEGTRMKELLEAQWFALRNIFAGSSPQLLCSIFRILFSESTV
ncbi:MAG: hypothetical protein ABSC17_08485 [Thermacetogeniaceae bacterium]